METIHDINKQQQKQQGFDEETSQKIHAYLEEIDAKRQQQQSSLDQTKYIKFVQDKESKSAIFHRQMRQGRSTSKRL